MAFPTALNSSRRYRVSELRSMEIAMLPCCTKMSICLVEVINVDLVVILVYNSSTKMGWDESVFLKAAVKLEFIITSDAGSGWFEDVLRGEGCVEMVLSLWCVDVDLCGVHCVRMMVSCGGDWNVGKVRREKKMSAEKNLYKKGTELSTHIKGTDTDNADKQMCRQ